MKTRFLLSLCIAGIAHGQVYTPPPAQQPASTAPPTDAGAAPAKQAPAQTPLGQEIPMLDPSAETITVGGVAIPLGDNRLLKARFEKYLSQPPESDEDAERYRETLAEILGTISPFRTGGPDLYSAFKLLPSASSYPGDANLCGSLAESIYMAMLAKQDVNGLKKLNNSIEEEKRAIISEGDWKARHEKDMSLGDSRSIKEKDPKKNQPAQAPGSGVNSLKYTETLRRIAEIEVLKKTNIARTEAQTLRTKAQYQVSMVQCCPTRR
jgi:hypothetical protein